MRNILASVAARTAFGVVAAVAVVLLAGAAGCDEYGGYYGGDAYTNPDCIGADGYNWCLAGSWSGSEIHEPSVAPMDFSSDW